ncbi:MULTISPECIES: ParB N-terminal domain-containing protein [Streptomyces]|uniref:ParB N-terminal domain-containing protein n=1 Tax=Streptomyces gibsoniae TaxID=3075529 RepID=A0ABU2U9Y4_9ACTN|nr:ParB N-terminal domain-containing protein [Streptomyces sp. DSM 41699]MDT0470063.1 ParB N-terminal domain-containing protein [Streptomyces sp. DSM 41699]
MSVFHEIEQVVPGGRSHAKTIELAAHPDNPRPDLGDLTEMIQSMRSVGVVQPLVVVTREAHLAAYPDHASAIGGARYVIIAGHRRAAAAAAADVYEVPIEVRPELSHEGLDLEVMAVENLQRRDLNPI